MLLGAFHGVNPGMGGCSRWRLYAGKSRRGSVWRACCRLGWGTACEIASPSSSACSQCTDNDAHVAMAGRSVARTARVGGCCDIAYLRAGWMRISMGADDLGHSRGHGTRGRTDGLPVWLGMEAATEHGAMPTTHRPRRILPPAHRHRGARNELSARDGGNRLVVFTKLGVGLPERLWINLDVIWAAALIGNRRLIVAYHGL